MPSIVKVIFTKFCFKFQLYRHGDRAIADMSYPKDPYRNESYWPMGIGQLTHVSY